MTNAKHTPGPWKAEERDSRVYVMSRSVKHPRANGATWHDVAYLCTTNGCDISDGRLIAAAPELLEALENLRMRCREKGWGKNDSFILIADAAIAKARGQ